MTNLDHAAEAAVASHVEPLTELAAARRLGLKVATLRAWRRQQRGPVYVRLGRAVATSPAMSTITFARIAMAHPP